MSAPLPKDTEPRKTRDVAPMLRIALLLGVLVHVAGFFFFRVLSNPLPTRSENSAYIALLSADESGGDLEMAEQASLFDSAPLFVPGKWSSASQVFPIGMAEDLQVFPEYEPSLELLDEIKPIRLSSLNVMDVQEPSDLLNLRFWNFYESFGESGEPAVELGNGKSVAVVNILSGNVDASPDVGLRIEFELDTDSFGLRPVVYYLSMSAPGLPIGTPVLRQSSGSDSLDAGALAWLLKPATLAALPAGYLEIRVFP